MNSHSIRIYFARKIREQGKDSNLSFFNFVEYISSIHRYHYESKKNKNGARYFEPHWAQYSTLCHPCHIDYDYIIKIRDNERRCSFLC